MIGCTVYFAIGLRILIGVVTSEDKASLRTSYVVRYNVGKRRGVQVRVTRSDLLVVLEREVG